MKTLITCIRPLLFCFLLSGMLKLHAQCIPTFTVAYGSNGTVSFNSAGSPSVGPGTTYFWSLGNGPTFSVTGAAGSTASATYSANGIYTVSLVTNNVSPNCNSAPYTMTIAVTSTISVCPLSIAITAATNASLCNGSATLSNLTNMCSGVTYSWSNGSTGSPVAGGFCGGTVYSVTATAAPGFPCCSVVSGTFLVPTCNLSASFTPTLYNSSQSFGVPVLLTSTSTGTNGTSSYYWDFGNGSFSITPQPTVVITYTNNSTYQVKLKVTNAGVCKDSITNPVVVPCALNASFLSQQTVGSQVNFTSNSIYVTPGANHIWSFGDNSPPSSGSNLVNTSHTYSAAGIYAATLTVVNTGSTACSDTQVGFVNVISTLTVCNLTANFSYTPVASGTVNFASTSTGVVPGSTYTWNFGDGSSSNSPSVPHTYTVAGNYNVSLMVDNNLSIPCTSTKTLALAVSLSSVIPCQINASFTHTVANNGLVSFNNTSTGTNGNTAYLWNFGDGVYSTQTSPVHTYAFGGAHYVSLIATNPTCGDTVVYAINVTGLPCVATAGFSLYPTNIPQYWTGIPLYPWTVTAAKWYWGDGTSTDSLYTEHIYASAAIYNICLTVTVSCGANDSTCSVHTVYKTFNADDEQSLVYVNIQKPALVTSIAPDYASGDAVLNIFPNPNSGEFKISLNGLRSSGVELSIYNLVGEMILNQQIKALDGRVEKTISLEAAAGIYLMRLNADGNNISKKLIITKH